MEDNKLRSLIVQVLDAVEDLMIFTGDKKTERDKLIWKTCYPLWVLLQKEVRKLHR